MPFITEEIWQRAAPLAGASGPTIMLQPYPRCDSAAVDSAANADIEWLKKVIIGVRNIRGEMNIPPGRNLTLLCRHGSDIDATRLRDNESFLKKLAKLETVGWLANDATAPVAATALVGDLELLVPMAGLIDKNSELNRLGKEIDKLEKEQTRLEAKLDNSAFVDRAPAEVVAKEREKLQAQQHALAKLRSQAEQMARL
jgi:valyl-tRNA synthetase